MIKYLIRLNYKYGNLPFFKKMVSFILMFTIPIILANLICIKFNKFDFLFLSMMSVIVIWRMIPSFYYLKNGKDLDVHDKK